MAFVLFFCNSGNIWQKLEIPTIYVLWIHQPTACVLMYFEINKNQIKVIATYFYGITL